MKKMTILAVILALAIALTACGKEEAPETTAAPETTVATTAAPETTVPSEPLTLTDWVMSANTWSSPNGATINISAATNYYEEGQKADFVVRLEGDDVAVIPCKWEPINIYTASVDLNAANGYCYYVILTAADGTTTEVAVNTPAEPTNEAFIDIEAALESYCSITIDDSTVEDDQLKLTAGKVQVKTPQITNENETITCQEAVLILSYNGEELERKALTLSQTETQGLLEAALDSITFTVPDMKKEQKVELTLNATLSNGQVLSAYGANWVFNEEGLMSVVG